MLITADMNTPIRILFVEDDAEMSAIYAENFSLPEFDITTASGGVEAWKLLENSAGSFDFVVTDNYMPGMDGMTLLRKIRKDFPNIKVVMVSGYGDWSSDSVNEQDKRGLRFLDKPVRMSNLKQLIRGWIL